MEQLLAQSNDVRLVTIDVTTDESVQAAALHIEGEDGRLDVLINNAGIVGSMPKTGRSQSVDDIRAVYDTNAFGAIRVTQALAPVG